MSEEFLDQILLIYPWYARCEIVLQLRNMLEDWETWYYRVIKDEYMWDLFQPKKRHRGERR